MQEKYLREDPLFHSLGCLYGQESDRERFFYFLKACDIFSKTLWIWIH